MLIVEDDTDIARLQHDILEGRADVTLLTEDFGRAFHAETWLGVDVAVIDLMLPDVDGEDVCRYLMANHAQIRRVICTAKPTYELPALQELAHVVLQKPFRASDFVVAVLGQVAGARRRRGDGSPR